MRDNLSILIIGKSGRNSVFRVPFPELFLVLTGAVLLFCLTFLSVILYNVSHYTVNQLFLIREEFKNTQLQGEVEFIARMSGDMGARITEVFGFDDNIRLLYGMSLIHKDIRQVGVGGPEGAVPDEADLLGPRYSEIRDLKASLDKMLRQTELESGSLAETRKEVVATSKRLRRFPSVLPVFGQITSLFGFRFHPIEQVYLNHEGVDIANVVWTPVYATADGVVRTANYTSGFGNLIILDHGYGYMTYYGHLQDFTVKPNQFVIRGDLIGYVGNSGRTTGPHLHYEIMKNCKPVDPLEFIYPVSTLMN
jgi:hypothetical protein